MKKIFVLILTLVILSSHDMFLKLDTYFLKPNDFATIKLFNGTFDNSDNVITRDRMFDVSLIGGGQRKAVDTAQWSEKDNTTFLHFTSGNSGTWVAGVSIKPRTLAMKAQDFNHYLDHDGVNNALETDAVEEYSKHVKVIFQVGGKVTEDYKSILGYPLEFVPMQNPYTLHSGQTLPIQLLWQGKALTNQLVYLGIKSHEYNHDHIHEEGHEHADGSDH
ncbi:MAG TPA: DUF4198 domain-containing protein, partial [Saprospiraceae bacterium]|nr:DUF4198 domain-containing protein [Saprospiraceae bacterium]